MLLAHYAFRNAPRAYRSFSSWRLHCANSSLLHTRTRTCLSITSVSRFEQQLSFQFCPTAVLLNGRSVSSYRRSPLERQVARSWGYSKAQRQPTKLPLLRPKKSFRSTTPKQKSSGKSSKHILRGQAANVKKRVAKYRQTIRLWKRHVAKPLSRNTSSSSKLIKGKKKQSTREKLRKKPKTPFKRTINVKGQLTQKSIEGKMKSTLTRNNKRKLLGKRKSVKPAVRKVKRKRIVKGISLLARRQKLEHALAKRAETAHLKKKTISKPFETPAARLEWYRDLRKKNVEKLHIKKWSGKTKRMLTKLEREMEKPPKISRKAMKTFLKRLSPTTDLSKLTPPELSDKYHELKKGVTDKERLRRAELARERLEGLGKLPEEVQQYTTDQFTEWWQRKKEWEEIQKGRRLAKREYKMGKLDFSPTLASDRMILLWLRKRQKKKKVEKAKLKTL